MGSPIDEATFLQRARARFGDHYDYGGIVYKSYKTPIRIRCRQHPVKVITITPEKHLTTTGGCKFCLRESRRRNPPTRTTSLEGASISRVVRLSRQVRAATAAVPSGG